MHPLEVPVPGLHRRLIRGHSVFLEKPAKHHDVKEDEPVKSLGMHVHVQENMFARILAMLNDAVVERT